MNKILVCGTAAEVGLKVRVIKGMEGYKKGDKTTITKVSGIVKNKINIDIDLNRWKNIVECDNKWLLHINSLKKLK